jgi:predicted glycosyltransferase
MPGADAKPSLLMYCQHSVGLGHLTRSLALAGALAERFAVVLMSGGSVPSQVVAPPGVEVVQLPPLAVEEGVGLVSGDRRRTVARAKAVRARALIEAVESLRPSAVVVELFPFGRRAFSGEIVAMLEAAQELPGAALFVCSVRDILVSRGGEQAAYDERAARLANAYFDAILVHADPRFARLEESFRPRTPLAIPVHYTGFVTAAPAAPAADRGDALRSGPIVVSAGGGRVGGPLLDAAIDAQALLWQALRVPMRLIAGPFLPEPEWRRMRRRTRSRTGLELVRAVPDLAVELLAARASVSQGGYNTTLEVLQARVPALVVPYFAPGEDEQSRRARRLAELGLVRVLHPAELDGPRLAAAIANTMEDSAPRVELDLGGARASGELLWRMVRDGVAPATERVSA